MGDKNGNGYGNGWERYYQEGSGETGNQHGGGRGFFSPWTRGDPDNPPIPSTGYGSLDWGE